MKNEENSNNNKVERWPVDTWYRNNGDQGDSNDVQNSAFVGSLFEVEEQVIPNLFYILMHTIHSFALITKICIEYANFL